MGVNHGGNNDNNINVMDVFENQKENFVLRPIEQNDLLTALKHIKSTMKAHNDHKRKYGTQNKNSLFANMGLFGGMNAAASSMSKQYEQTKGKGDDDADDEDADEEADDDILELE